MQVKSRLYYITPAILPGPRQLIDLVAAVLPSGIGMIQYRAKHASTARMFEDVQALLRLTRPAGIPLVVNDRLDVALAAGADGVHVGAEDLPVSLVRRLAGPRAIVGASADTPAMARRAERDGASYVGSGAAFPTPIKPDYEVIGPSGLAAICRTVSVPVCAIGGITRENLSSLQAAAPDLIAVISAINDAADPPRAACELVAAAAELWSAPPPQFALWDTPLLPA